MNDGTRIMPIETSGRTGSVAVARGPDLLAEHRFKDQLNHAAELLPTMDRLCHLRNWRPCDIEHLYISAGPGSFTGIRIAVTAAKTLAFAQETKIVAVPSTDALVLNADAADAVNRQEPQNIAVVLEAGRGQIFAAVFERSADPSGQPTNRSGLAGVRRFGTLIDAARMNPTELLERTARPLYLMGEGLRYHPDELSGDGLIWLDEGLWSGRAANVHRCGWLRAQAGQFADAETLTPIYLRRPEAIDRWHERFQHDRNTNPQGQ